MKKICLRYPVCFLCLLIGLAACQNGPKSQLAPENTGTTIDTALVARPDGQDLLKLLRGKWLSETDSAYQLEITDSLVVHRYEGRVQQETRIEIDAACSSRDCTVEGLPNDGWCFVEKDASGSVQCMLVLKCDEKILHLRPLGAANPQLSFKKI